MNADIYDALIEILDELKKDRSNIDEQLQRNLQCIKEAEVYAKTFLSSEPDDVKVFSPRNPDVIYKNEIESMERKKSHCECENKSLDQKKKIISSRIDRIEKILESESKNIAVLSIQEEDRRRIARDLHDSSLQNLAHLIHQIELSGLYIDEDPIRAKLELSVVNMRLKEIIDDIRNTIFDLRPMIFDDLGLKAVLERMIENINKDKHYDVELDLENVSCETNIILDSIYRVVQECLNNIVKHAEATKIFLSCKCKSNNCHIVISDNGKGFQEAVDDGKKHFGIFCMKERINLLGGKIHFDSAPKKGTTISIDVPLDTCMV